MKLSDLMSRFGLEVYAEVGLILFLFAFALISVRLLFMQRSESVQLAKLPLDGDDGQPRPRGELQ
jgi:hypothetical protein